jgi:hypothetical protein
MIFRAARKEEGIHAIEVREQRRGGASLFWCRKRLAIRLRVVPGAAEFGICVENGAQVFGLSVPVPGARRSCGGLRCVRCVAVRLGLVEIEGNLRLEQVQFRRRFDA